MNTLSTSDFLHLVRITDNLVAFGRITKGEASDILDKTGYRSIAKNEWLAPNGNTVQIVERT